MCYYSWLSVSEFVLHVFRCKYIDMSLARRFVKSEVKELLPNVWSVIITYSYYSMYDFTESHICNTLESALRWLLVQRCGSDRLRVVDAHGVNVSLI